MSLRITRAGLLDTIQDGGRYSYQHQGINPGGAVDRFSAALANALLGKSLMAPVIEMHFPAAQMLFEKDCIVCLAGTDFAPAINETLAPLHQPFLVKEQSVLSFREWKNGARCYLSLLNEFQLNGWLNSFSTNLKAGAGGFNGRKLQKGDQLVFDLLALPHIEDSSMALPWKYNQSFEQKDTVAFIPGPEWEWLTPKSRQTFLNEAFEITSASDRMGYRLEGKALEQGKREQLVSSAVCFGTVQLLPDGQLIILMADHQTTGGYPRIANIISTHLPTLAQMKPGEGLRFEETDIASAEQKLAEQNSFLLQLQQTCQQKMQNWLHAH